MKLKPVILSLLMVLRHIHCEELVFRREVLLVVDGRHEYQPEKLSKIIER